MLGWLAQALAATCQIGRGLTTFLWRRFPRWLLVNAPEGWSVSIEFPSDLPFGSQCLNHNPLNFIERDLIARGTKVR